jgi:hypothetical protein
VKFIGQELSPRDRLDAIASLLHQEELQVSTDIMGGKCYPGFICHLNNNSIEQQGTLKTKGRTVGADPTYKQMVSSQNRNKRWQRDKTSIPIF